jgi:hypothetical protein
MALLVKVGNKTDLPAEPVNWPRCGNFYNRRLKENEASVKNKSNRQFYLNKSCFLSFCLSFFFIF